MPDPMRKDLERNIETALGGTPAQTILQHAEQTGTMPQFAALHFSYYARSGTKVRDYDRLSPHVLMEHIGQ